MSKNRKNIQTTDEEIVDVEVVETESSETTEVVVDDAKSEGKLSKLKKFAPFVIVGGIVAVAIAIGKGMTGSSVDFEDLADSDESEGDENDMEETPDNEDAE